MDLDNMMWYRQLDGNAVRMRYATCSMMLPLRMSWSGSTAKTPQSASKKLRRRRVFDSSLYGEMVETYVEGLAGRDAFFKAIMDERAWEFGGEGIRRNMTSHAGTNIRNSDIPL